MNYCYVIQDEHLRILGVFDSKDHALKSIRETYQGCNIRIDPNPELEDRIFTATISEEKRILTIKRCPFLQRSTFVL